MNQGKKNALPGGLILDIVEFFWYIASTTNCNFMSHLKHYLLTGMGCYLFAAAFAQSDWPVRDPLSDSSLSQLADIELNNAPPPILYQNKLSKLVWIDGPPSIIVDEALRMYRIGNTPHLIIKNHNDNKYYLYNGQKNWYVSDSSTIGYKYKTFQTLPGVIKLMDSLVNRMQHGVKHTVTKTTTTNSKAHPAIVVVQDPTELIYTNGQPVYKNIPGTRLFYAKNTTQNIFIDSASIKNYILLSGRWYSSHAGLHGPWEYVPADKLPEDFYKIQETSEKAEVLPHIAGTKAAMDAIKSTQLLYVTKIKRHVDSNFVVYDGGAEFGSYSNTGLFIAENSNVPVLNYKETYYALKEGVWYTSKEALGPWVLSNTRPPEIDKIPPQHKLYFTRHVYITDTTGNYVVTGYNAGYLNTYVQDNAIVYGTGWKYKPWFRQQFFIYPATMLSSVKYASIRQLK